MRRTLSLALVLLAVVATPAAADDDRPHFRRTTPRATLEEDAGTLTLGVPSGRAWGIESELRPLPLERALAVRLAVSDNDVREAFARASPITRARRDGPGRSPSPTAEAVAAGEGRVLFVPLDPPPGAVAYRVRVLARLRAGASSSDDAITARVTLIDRAATRFGSLFSRLLPDAP